MKRNWIAPALLVLLTLGLGACESVDIARLQSDPARWNNKVVHIHGIVETGAGILGRGGYYVSDNTGRILVISGSGVPARGARIDVEGTVFQGAQFMGQSYGVAIRERRHHTH